MDVVPRQSLGPRDRDVPACGVPVAVVEVRESPIHGKGVFSVRGFDPGETILVIDLSRVVDDAHPLDASKGEFEHHCEWFGDLQVLLPEPERYINHSCEPSTYIVTIEGLRRVLAYRRIEVGDEVTYDYLIDAYGDVEWECSCGAATCRRKHVHDFFTLPDHKLREYLPLLNPWFVEWRRTEVEELRKRLGE